MIKAANDIYIDDTGTEKGRGVFAARKFNIGETVEVSPVILINPEYQKMPPEIKRVIFAWSKLTGTEPLMEALALGFGSLYNHANPSNMRYQADNEACTLRYIAVRDIQKGEELTINYNAVGGGYEWNDDNWFKRNQIKPVA